MRDLEHKIQCTCVRWFRLQYHQYAELLFAVPNGGARDAVTGAKLKEEGVLAGVADLMLLLPRKGFRSLCIEMKTPSKASRQQTSQKDWQKAVEAQGYKYVVCRSVDDFVDVIDNYLTV